GSERPALPGGLLHRLLAELAHLGLGRRLRRRAEQVAAGEHQRENADPDRTSHGSPPGSRALTARAPKGGVAAAARATSAARRPSAEQVGARPAARGPSAAGQQRPGGAGRLTRPPGGLACPTRRASISTRRSAPAGPCAATAPCRFPTRS